MKWWVEMYDWPACEMQDGQESQMPVQRQWELGWGGSGWLPRNQVGGQTAIIGGDQPPVSLRNGALESPAAECCLPLSHWCCRKISLHHPCPRQLGCQRNTPSSTSLGGPSQAPRVLAPDSQFFQAFLIHRGTRAQTAASPWIATLVPASLSSWEPAQACLPTPAPQNKGCVLPCPPYSISIRQSTDQLICAHPA